MKRRIKTVSTAVGTGTQAAANFCRALVDRLIHSIQNLSNLRWLPDRACFVSSSEFLRTWPLCRAIKGQGSAVFGEVQGRRQHIIDRRKARFALNIIVDEQLETIEDQRQTVLGQAKWGHVEPASVGAVRQKYPLAAS